MHPFFGSYWRTCPSKRREQTKRDEPKEYTPKETVDSNQEGIKGSPKITTLEQAW